MRFLIDEMFPRDTARRLRDDHGHRAEHVAEVGLTASPDGDIAALALATHAVVVTENAADFSGVPDLTVVFVLKRRLPAGGAQAAALASVLDTWAREHPRPYVGHHWPS